MPRVRLIALAPDRWRSNRRWRSQRKPPAICSLGEACYRLISANGFLVTSETERRLRVAARAMSLSSACMLTSPGYNPFAGRSGEERRDWLLFVLWLTRQQHSAAGAWRHVEWVLRLRPPRRSSPRNSRAWSLSSSSLPCSGRDLVKPCRLFARRAARSAPSKACRSPVRSATTRSASSRVSSPLCNAARWRGLGCPAATIVLPSPTARQADQRVDSHPPFNLSH